MLQKSILRRRFNVLLLSITFQLTLSAQPSITSFSPASGPAGTTVTIAGANFNADAVGNTVYFGAVKAQVTAASVTSLTVTVPAGATYKPLSVLNTANGFTGYASKPFISTFTNPLAPGIPDNFYLPRVNFATGTLPYTTAIGDLDGDGRSDIAVVNSSSNTVSVLRNTSSTGSISASSFTTKTDFATGSEPRAIAIADLDGDGKPDMVVTNSNAGTVSVFRNTSTTGSISAASFASGVEFPVGGYSYSVATGDLDLDGKPDLVVTNLASGTISILRNTASTGIISASSFADRLDIITGSKPRFVALGDLDGDGKVDIAVANDESATVSVLCNTATTGNLDAASFAAKTDFATGINPLGVTIGDIDDDGRPEMSVVNFGSGTVSVFRNTSTAGGITAASFAEKVDVAVGPQPFALMMSDADGDGKADLLTVNAGNSTLSVLRNMASGGSITDACFTKTDFNTGGYPVYLSIADLDNDGKPEVVTANAANNDVSVLRMATPASVVVKPVINSVSPSSAPAGTQVAINGSGFDPSPAGNIVYFGAVKAAVTGGTSTSLTVTVPAGATYQPVSVLNSSTGLAGSSSLPFITTFTNPLDSGITTGYYKPRVDFSVVGNVPYGVALGDLDGDGKPDLVAASNNTGIISIRRNTSATGSVDASSFGAEVLFFERDPFYVIIKDMDNDGKPDIVALDLNGSSVSVLRNTSAPGTINSSSFSSNTYNLRLNTYAYSVAVGDVDSDGRPDIVIANAVNNTVSVLKNTSSPGNITDVSFTTRTDFAVGAFPRFVVIGDLDGDSRPELIVANQNDNTVSVLKNMSTTGIITAESFAARVDFATGNSPGGIVLGDVDGDGRTDVSVLNHASNTVSVLRNMSVEGSIDASSLAAGVDFATGSLPYAGVMTDADGDGKPDLVVANANSNTISVLRNTASAGSITSASFAGKVDFTAGGYPVSITAGDVDGDGIPELVSGSAPGSSGTFVSVFRINVSTPAPPGNAPVITSFAPVTGPVGSTVTITGSNFNATPAGNTVYFGAVKAQVTAGSATSLSVTVPAGATYQPVSVLNNSVGLAGYSSKPFVTTFTNPSTTGELPPDYYAPRVDFAAGASPRSVAIGDLDGDGKPDIVIANEVSGTISVIRNTATTGVFNSSSLAQKVDFAVGPSAFSVALGDMDGDGMLDIVATSAGMVSVFRNTSTAGSITPASFADRADFPVGDTPFSVAVGDLDYDGRPDIAVANTGSNTVSVLRNTSVAGTIDASSFAPKIDFTVSRARFVKMNDIDHDGRIDLVVTIQGGLSRFDGSIAVLLNTSTMGVINSNSFGSPAIFAAQGASGPFSVFDIDGDERPDIVYSYPGNISIRLLRNVSVSGTPSFTRSDDLPLGQGVSGQAVGDLTGDGKPDLVVCDNQLSRIAVFRNTATQGTVNFTSFDFREEFLTGAEPVAAAIGDLDGDGIPEVVVANNLSNTISVLSTNPPSRSATMAQGLLPALALGEQAKDMQVFPNPTSGECTVLLSGMAAAGTLEILNQQGTVIEKRMLNLNDKATAFVQKLSLRNQPAGVYFVKLTTTKGVQVAKVVVQR